MASLTLELPAEVYGRLRAEAERVGKPVETLASEWLAERVPAALTEADRYVAVMRAAGLLVEPTPEELEEAANCTVTLEEVQAAFARAGGKPLSEIVLEMRGPKE